jgi:hypothetical protein
MHRFKKISMVLCFALSFTALNTQYGAAQTPPKIPLGEEVHGIKLSGPLKGRKVYRLTADINYPHCWQDSVQWTGEFLYFGMSSIDFSKLLSGKGLRYKKECARPSSQNSPKFDIYRANLVNEKWKIQNETVLNSHESDASISISGSHMAFIRFLPPPESYDIFFSTRNNKGQWQTTAPYQFNSKCKEDNPALFDNARRMIFESNRKNPKGTKCHSSGEHMALWFSKRLTKDTWSVPTRLKGDPNKKKKNTQPWIDEANNYLYWTADKEGNSIKRVKFSETQKMTDSEFILSPNMKALHDGSAHGKAVFIGEYSEVGDYAFIACAIASSGGDFLKKWDIDVDICVIPPK